MPTISVFYGIISDVLAGSGAAAFHALYAEHEALIETARFSRHPRSLPERA